MAERSTAAVDVADNGGDEPLPAKQNTAEETTADGVAEAQEAQEAREARENTEESASEKASDTTTDEPRSAGTDPVAPELHSGHKLARRYRLEECVTRLDGFSSWRAVDEKLRRAVGVHILPAEHPRARSVLAAARSAALLGDPRFVQVLDAVEENDLVYVVHEWLPDSVELTALLASGRIEAHDAYQLVSQVSQAMAAAHREGLAHLRLTPSAVLRASTGQYRIRGLAVNAALRGITADRPQRADTEAIGALLYASLTQRWPYETDAYGLTGLPKGVGLLPPDQVRAGVHRGLSELSMRALANDGATASRQDPPCTTPDELAKAVAGMPRIRPPEPAFAAPPDYQRTTYQQGSYGNPKPGPRSAPVPPPVVPPPPLQTPPGRVLKWVVSVLVIVALGLGSWQIADHVINNHSGDDTPPPTKVSKDDGDKAPAAPKPIAITGVQDFDPPPHGNGSENPEDAPKAIDGNPATAWDTKRYIGEPTFGNQKTGVGLILDLGQVRTIGSVTVDFVGETSVELRAAAPDATARPTGVDGFTRIAEGTGTKVPLKPSEAVKSRYVLVWLTKLPATGDGGWRGQVSEIHVTS